LKKRKKNTWFLTDNEQNINSEEKWKLQMILNTLVLMTTK
jgi:hypothetical protein